MAYRSARITISKQLTADKGRLAQVSKRLGTAGLSRRMTRKSQRVVARGRRSQVLPDLSDPENPALQLVKRLT
jgi:hypothetical protein